MQLAELAMAIALGRVAADYLHDVFLGAGLWLPTMIAAAALAAVQTFDRAAHAPPDLDSAVALRTTLAVAWACWSGTTDCGSSSC